MAGFHREVQAVVRAAPDAHKWALFERDPLPRWTDGAVTLLGDACHPMTPYMAQGAASALEDAAVLARCLRAHAEPAAAFAAYEATRRDRTSRIQLTSRENSWGRTRHDTSWVYEYDALTVPLEAERPSAARS
jgi:salicylate hydroxylase/6-hydroxynicotinate 3-monooxygenase